MKPGAMVVIYPHDFPGTPVPGFGVDAVQQPFDTRSTRFFTRPPAPTSTGP
jgi:hypothetical protein